MNLFRPRNTWIALFTVVASLVIPVVAAHPRGITHTVSARDLIEYTAPEITELPESLREARTIRVRTLIFHDWAYPVWDRIEAT